MPATASTYELSKRSYYADFFTVPAATSVAVLWMLSLHNFDPFRFVSGVIAGAFAWTFIEYATHRWLLHGTHNAEHRFHHIRPRDFIGVSPVGTAIIGAFSFWFLTTIFGAVIGVGLLVGLSCGYLFYIFVHDRMHHGFVSSGTYLATLNRNHDYHHFRFRVNFGATSPIWDYVFGTFQESPVKPANER